MTELGTDSGPATSEVWLHASCVLGCRQTKDRHVFIYFQVHKLVLLKKKKSDIYSSRAVFTENHVRPKRRQERTTEPWPFRGELLSPSSSPALGRWLEQRSWGRREGSAGRLAPGTALQEALGRNLQR